MKKVFFIILSLVLVIFSVGTLLVYFKYNDGFIELDSKGKHHHVDKDNNSSDKYQNLSEILKTSNIEIPIYENLIPQGLVMVDDYIFISVYDNMGLINSKVYVIDNDGNVINVITLDTNSHVGGLAYDSLNKLIWIPDNEGALNAYNVKDFYKKSHAFYKYRFSDLSNELVDFRDDEKREVDYLTIVNDDLFIGNFSLKGEGIVKKYKIKNNESLDLEFVNKFKVQDKVQGIAFYDNYMFLSVSYGRKKPSYLYVYNYEEDIDDYNIPPFANFKLPSMLEQIDIHNNKVYLIFENTAKKYQDSIDKIGHIGILDIDKLIKE